MFTYELFVACLQEGGRKPTRNKRQEVWRRVYHHFSLSRSTSRRSSFVSAPTHPPHSTSRLHIHLKPYLPDYVKAADRFDFQRPVNHNVSYQGESKLLVKSEMSRDPPKRKCSVQVSSCCHASSTVSAVKSTKFPKKKKDTARNNFSTIKQLNKHL